MKIKLEVLVSLTAMVTAIAAVVVAIVQTQVMREEAELERTHTRLSVRPFIVINSHTDTTNSQGSFSIEIKNEGLGPAVIESFLLELEKKKISGWRALVDAAKKNEKNNQLSLKISESTINKGMLLPAGGHRQFLRLEADVEFIKRVKNVGDKALLSLCYCSLYEECWAITSEMERPDRVMSCEQ
ncbi:hypothetical protein [Pleionea sp. CnH1-48]|uniref:hypothetical protein n=1 Tax=Pleionea sp. CnH1-48 TaxID=2954494 RepID=UPI0020974EA9|nr:hypothetical protein [Pleionea sp. CnH1-48]MCO7224767.1 hypothetical protein [Pleionea sp. CnH1-48]